MELHTPSLHSCSLSTRRAGLSSKIALLRKLTGPGTVRPDPGVGSTACHSRLAPSMGGAVRLQGMELSRNETFCRARGASETQYAPVSQCRFKRGRRGGGRNP